MQYPMLFSTTFTIDGMQIIENKGLVFGETVHGMNFIKDIGASFRNFVGGRSAGYEDEMIQARGEVLDEMASRAQAIGANAVVGIRFNYVAMGQGNMLMVSAAGTAVVVQ